MLTHFSKKFVTFVMVYLYYIYKLKFEKFITKPPCHCGLDPQSLAVYLPTIHEIADQVRNDTRDNIYNMITDFRLKAFITVARTLSFTRSADMLNVSQPAISKHIKELEAEFSEPLFNRQGNRISLTEKGAQIVPLVEQLLEDYNKLSDSITERSTGFEGHINIGASTTIAQYVLPPILAQFNNRYPQIKLSVISANSDEVIELLQRKEVDIALIEGDKVAKSIHYTELSTDKIVLVSTKHHTAPITTEQLTKLPLLIREEGSGTLSVVMHALRKRGIARKRLNIKMQLGSSEAIINYLKASGDYAFISILVAQEHLNRGELNVVDVQGVEILRNFRFAKLHGQSGRLISLFESFCGAF